jgi:hypothetical protein
MRHERFQSSIPFHVVTATETLNVFGAIVSCVVVDVVAVECRPIAARPFAMG